MLRYTVVIPNHNYGDWICGAINSITNDPYPNKQLVVVDDGSTDNSWENICSILNINLKVNPNNISFGSFNGMPAMALRHSQSEGPSKARNDGIKIMWEHTDIFGFLDADDEYKNGKITQSIKKMEEDIKCIGAVYSDYDIVNEDGLITREYKEPFSRKGLLDKCIVHSACIVSRAALEACGLYDEELRVGEDYDLWLRISEKYCITHIPESLMFVRNHQKNSTNTVSKEKWEQDIKKVMIKTQKRMLNGQS